MLKCFPRYLILFIIAFLAISCSNTNNRPIIQFSADSTSIIIKNIDEASLLQVKNAHKDSSNAFNLVTVLLKPGELDSVQDELEVPGKINIAGDSLVFNPDSSFVKGKTYVVESYIGVKFATVGNLISGNAKQNLQAQRQTLRR
ncbi:hypothetical protein D3C87_446430 [compost metagenome]